METIENSVKQGQDQLTPKRIIETGMGFWASKTLLTAVNLGLFTRLGKGPLPAARLGEKLGLHPRALYDFLDALMAMGFLNRKGLMETAVYSNSEESAAFLDKRKRSYIGGMLEMSNNRLYPFWNRLEDGLKSGKPQNEIKDGSAPFFEVLYSDERRLREFINAMGAFQMGSFMAFADSFDFSGYQTLCDIGGAGASLSAQVTIHHPHIQCISFDLPKVSKIASENMELMDFTPRVKITSGDFFKDDFPEADVITMGNILHDWGSSDKQMLISKAYKALPEGGSLVVIENIIDDDRRENLFGLLMSLNMLIETYEGFDFTATDFNEWAQEAGFRSTRILPLTGPSSAAIAIK